VHIAKTAEPASHIRHDVVGDGGAWFCAPQPLSLGVGAFITSPRLQICHRLCRRVPDHVNPAAPRSAKGETREWSPARFAAGKQWIHVENRPKPFSGSAIGLGDLKVAVLACPSMAMRLVEEGFKLGINTSFT